MTVSGVRPDEPTATILLVEQDPQARAQLRTLLEKGGYRILEAGDGAAARRIAEQSGPIHLLVTDVKLASLSGPELALRLREHFPDLRVIYTSEQDLDDLLSEPYILEHGFGFLQKPFTSAALTEWVNGVLGSMSKRLGPNETENKEKEIEDSVLWRAEIVESSDDAVIGESLKGIIHSWNKRAEQVYGYSASEMLGRPMTLLLPADRAEEETGILRRIQTGERVAHLETVRIAKDGRPINVSLTVSPIHGRDGSIIGASQIARDITESKRNERNAELLAAIVESSEDAIIGKNLEGIIQSWNEGAERLYGYEQGEILGKSMTLLLPADRPDEENEILGRIRNGDRVAHFETVRIRKDGKAIDVSLTISPIRDRNGVVSGASHVGRDITETKRFNDQLRDTQRLESLGVLAGGVAHDFNNLLTGILGNASLVYDTLSPSNPNRSLIAYVIKAAERAADLTRQLLAYAGKGRFVTTLINLSDLVREISNLVQASIPHNVQLRLELEPDLPLVEADVGQIQQVVMNLVINGAEAVGEQPGTVLVATHPQDIEQSYLATVWVKTGLSPGRYVALEVHDTGSGMDEATKSRIFDPFFTTKFTGRGLGLAAVMGIVRGHKGALKVYSAPGMGTTMKVLLPVATEAKPAVPDQDSDAQVQAHANETILVVDDEEIIRNTARNAMETYGYSVIAARDGREAVELFRSQSESISLVLLDLSMPLMSGEETLRLLKSIRPSVKVLLSSGYNEVEATRHFTGKGLAGFIQKPYTALNLVKRIREALDYPSGGA